MAQALLFRCDGCCHAVTAWSEGNPYYLDEAGAKHYAYHPDHEGLARCIGNDAPHHCLGCAADFVVDSRAPIDSCPYCGDCKIANSYHLEGLRCPKCKVGTFAVDPSFQMIS
jgi:hypothetical protein